MIFSGGFTSIGGARGPPQHSLPCGQSFKKYLIVLQNITFFLHRSYNMLSIARITQKRVLKPPISERPHTLGLLPPTFFKILIPPLYLMDNLFTAHPP